MLTLGIDTSCDDTAISVVEDGKIIHSNVIASQSDLLEKYGGVFPEMACRRHIEMCKPVLEEALGDFSLDQIDLIAATYGPGLMGALLIGLNFAKALALSTGKPFVGVNHIQAHLYAAMMNQNVALPALGVVISGGHTALAIIEKVGSYQLIGKTQDDAIGEAFDKVARLLGLGFPGGSQIEELAKSGCSHAYPFKGGCVKKHPLDLSFSGLKTAVLYATQKEGYVQEDIAASFQHAAFTSLMDKIFLASKKYHFKSIVLGGGVSSSQTLRAMMQERFDLPIYWPPQQLCLDNGAMIAALGYENYKQNGASPLDLKASARLPFHTDELCKL